MKKNPFFTTVFTYIQGYFTNQMQNTEIVFSPTEMLSSLKDVLRSNIITLFRVVIL